MAPYVSADLDPAELELLEKVLEGLLRDEVITVRTDERMVLERILSKLEVTKLEVSP